MPKTINDHVGRREKKDAFKAPALVMSTWIEWLRKHNDDADDYVRAVRRHAEVKARVLTDQMTYWTIMYLDGPSAPEVVVNAAVDKRGRLAFMTQEFDGHIDVVVAPVAPHKRGKR